MSIEHYPLINILLATFNGEKYIGEQVRSLQRQTYSNWRLLVRDDGSSDETVQVLRDMVANDSRIRVFDSAEGNFGVVRSYSWLLEHSGTDAHYTMFCDQDDVWFEDKISETLRLMRAMEMKYGESCPILVHTDLAVVDNKLQLLEMSYWKYHNIDPTLDSLNRLVVQNVVTGCTTMINSSLLEMSRPVPDEALMHDWWLALTAATFGEIGCLAKQTMLYRQHGNNVVGAKKWSLSLVASKAVSVLSQNEVKRKLKSAQKQSSKFVELFSARDVGGRMRCAEEFGRLSTYGFIRRRWILLKFKLFKNGLLRSIGLMLSV